MKFIDEATILVQSGNGGQGCVSFRRERFVPKGGPDGGDGGRGGDVILLASPQRSTLYHFTFQRQYKAGNGRPGQGRRKTGKDGEDLIIEVPPGTLVINAESGELITDLTRSGETVTVARGGRGGQGNTRFKTSTHQTPRFAQPGEPGESLSLKLELKLLADVGIMGFPNAGKSTLISALSAARPKIADYPFTTLHPNLGVVHPPWGGEPFVVADVPGLIEGAHSGAGLGIRFLKHLERTRLLIHLMDAGEIDPDHPLDRYTAINSELASYRPELAEKPQLLVLNKMDLPGADVAAELFRMAAPNLPFLTISAAARTGLDELMRRVTRMLASISHEEPQEISDDGTGS